MAEMMARRGESRNLSRAVGGSHGFCRRDHGHCGPRFAIMRVKRVVRSLFKCLDSEGIVGANLRATAFQQV
jgi:hypothetical protein